MAMHAVQETEINDLRRERNALEAEVRQLRKNVTLEKELMRANDEKQELLAEFEVKLSELEERAEHLKALNRIQNDRIRKMGFDGVVMFKMIGQLQALLTKNGITPPIFNQNGDVIE